MDRNYACTQFIKAFILTPSVWQKIMEHRKSYILHLQQQFIKNKIAVHTIGIAVGQGSGVKEEMDNRLWTDLSFYL